MFMPFHVLGYRMLFLICHSAPALSVAIWVRSFIKAAAIPASSALFMELLMLILQYLLW
jgi:hypothetical protein